MQIKSTTIGAGLITAVLATGLATAPTALASPSIAGTYNTTPITRVLDTRAGLGAPKTSVAAGQTLTVKVTASLPTSVAAVALHVTVAAPAQLGYLVVYPGGTTRPSTSNINFYPGADTPDSVVVAPGAGGTVSFYNSSRGTVNLVADRYGYWTAGTVDAATDGAFTPVTPMRVADSRKSVTTLGAMASGSVLVAGHAGVPATNVSAVVATVTAVDPSRTGFLRATAASTDSDSTSTVNFVGGRTRANLDTVPLNTDGSISITNSSTGKADYVVDVLGYFTGGTPQADGAFTATTPYRTEDTRTDGSTPAANSTLIVQVFPNDGTGALFKAAVVNVTATSSTAAGYLVPSDGVGTAPGTSAANFQPGEATADTVIVPVKADGSIAIRNASAGSVDVVVDVEGFILNDLSGMTPGAARSRIQKAERTARVFAAQRLAR